MFTLDTEIRDIRVNLSLDKHTHNKLKRVAYEFDVSKTALAAQIVQMALDDDGLMEYMAENYARWASARKK